MKRAYRRMFDEVRLPQSHQERIRSALSSHIVEDQKEDAPMQVKPNSIRISRVLAVAAVAALALALAGFTFGNQIIELLGGGRIVRGQDGEGNQYVSVDSGFAADPVEVRDGRIYFVLDGSGTDITDQCSETEYYRFESKDGGGRLRVVLIGGTPDRVGMAEFVWDEDGAFLASNASYDTEEEPAWLVSGREALGLG